MTENNPSAIPKISIPLRWKRLFIAGEIVLLFAIALTFILVMDGVAKDNPLVKQLIVWVANIIMLLLVWISLRFHGERLVDLGLIFKPITGREIIKAFLLSLLVFVLAMIGFMVGSIIMANISGIPQSTNLSGYDFLKDNIGLLAVTLIGVYIASSLGEEVVYRAFLINRISQLTLNTNAGLVLAVIVSSIIFGLVHYEWGITGVVQTGFMGLALGICYIKLKKRLWILVLAHAYMDTILMVQLYLASN